MKVLRIFVGLILVDFLAFTGYVLFQYGPVGWIPPLMENPATMLAVVDLVLALGVAVGFMINDAKKQGINVIPYVVLTLLTGSAGPLAYLIRRLRPAKENVESLDAIQQPI